MDYMRCMHQRLTPSPCVMQGYVRYVSISGTLTWLASQDTRQQLLQK